MRRGRWGLLAVVAAAVTAGCFWVRKPYADDPLVRYRPSPTDEAVGPPTGGPVPRPTPPDRSRVRGLETP